jgi:hypothetical protein
MSVKCPNHRGGTGCTKMITFGREGARLMEHVAICEYGLVECSDCKESMFRRDMANHRPGGNASGHGIGPCPRMPQLCDICNISISYSDVATHNNSFLHQNNIVKRSSRIFEQVSKLEADMKAQAAVVEALRTEIADMKKQQVSITSECDHKITEMETRHEMKLAEMRSQLSSSLVEFEVSKWSEIKDTAVFSRSTSSRVWSHDWWLKIEKGDDRIGVYLCCGEEGIFPITVDYQLMVRKRYSDDVVAVSSRFTTEFGREKAWGLAKFTSLEALERDGAYYRNEDKITFGCRIYPGKGVLWGRPSRRAHVGASPHQFYPPIPPSLIT